MKSSLLHNSIKSAANQKSKSSSTPTAQLQDKRRYSHVQQAFGQLANSGKTAIQMKELGQILNGNSPLQKMDLKEEEPLQGKFEAIQKQGLEEEELIQGKFKTIQKMEIEEEEPLQGKFETIQKQGLEEEELIQGKFKAIQKMDLDEEVPIQGKFETIQKQENNTGLPDNLKSGIEDLSGYSMDDVKVHYNSDKPATLQAHAYAQGTDIHIAPGQEKHLPHEAWHVVQQKQGRVRPTIQLQNKVNVNDDAGLEKEADVMGGKAVLQEKKNEPQKEGSKISNRNEDKKLTNRFAFHQNSDLKNNLIQRWNIRRPNIDWSETNEVEPLISRPVLFFDDQNNNRIVVKGENVSIGETLLANMLHEQIDGSKVVFTRDITADKVTINNIIDDPAQSGNNPNWVQIHNQFPNILPPNYPNLANLTADEKGRKSRQEHFNILPKLQVMDFVPDKTAGKLSEIGGNNGNYKTMRALLLDKNHVQQLGKITAVDLFLENDDRVLSGNLGNWMVDQSGGITLIDQLNNNAMNLLDDNGTGPNGILGPTNCLTLLLPGNIPTTVDNCINSMFQSMIHAGDTTINDWANEHGGTIRTKIELNFTIGIKIGINELKKSLHTNKSKRKGRGLKHASSFFENTDNLSGNGPVIHFWDRLKARARLL